MGLFEKWQDKRTQNKAEIKARYTEAKARLVEAQEELRIEEEKVANMDETLDRIEKEERAKVENLRNEYGNSEATTDDKRQRDHQELIAAEQQETNKRIEELRGDIRNTPDTPRIQNDDF